MNVLREPRSETLLRNNNRNIRVNQKQTRFNKSSKGSIIQLTEYTFKGQSNNQKGLVVPIAERRGPLQEIWSEDTKLLKSDLSKISQPIVSTHPSYQERLEKILKSPPMGLYNACCSQAFSVVPSKLNEAREHLKQQEDQMLVDRIRSCYQTNQ